MVTVTRRYPDSKDFFQTRMRRPGVITGLVLDENGIGIRNATVHACPAHHPPRSVATATTCNRAGSPRRRLGNPGHVCAGSDPIDVRPIPGKLFSVGGLIRCAVEAAGPVVLTLSSDSMRWQINGKCSGSYSFDGVAPGYLRDFGVDRRTSGGYFEQRFEQRSGSATIQLRPFQEVTPAFQNENRQPVSDLSYRRSIT